ncbi:MAG: uncharacterized protein KVP18_002906 [Porospora cf. gigantea A]|uniref:uncharacterized protein n=1 Tax=Porospora cf. gigantea A TaxID=2853593 RepID=UPI00355A5356|nr:MAG: hypothetical protein KVP18_002906 [Porospora cf. gigantea A]
MYEDRTVGVTWNIEQSLKESISHMQNVVNREISESISTVERTRQQAAKADAEATRLEAETMAVVEERSAVECRLREGEAALEETISYVSADVQEGEALRIQFDGLLKRVEDSIDLAESRDESFLQDHKAVSSQAQEAVEGITRCLDDRPRLNSALVEAQAEESRLEECLQNARSIYEERRVNHASLAQEMDAVRARKKELQKQKEHRDQERMAVLAEHARLSGKKPQLEAAEAALADVKKFKHALGKETQQQASLKTDKETKKAAFSAYLDRKLLLDDSVCMLRDALKAEEDACIEATREEEDLICEKRRIQGVLLKRSEEWQEATKSIDTAELEVAQVQAAVAAAEELAQSAMAQRDKAKKLHAKALGRRQVELTNVQRLETERSRLKKDVASLEKEVEFLLADVKTQEETLAGMQRESEASEAEAARLLKDVESLLGTATDELNELTRAEATATREGAKLSQAILATEAHLQVQAENVLALQATLSSLQEEKSAATRTILHVRVIRGASVEPSGLSAETCLGNRGVTTTGIPGVREKVHGSQIEGVAGARLRVNLGPWLPCLRWKSCRVFCLAASAFRRPEYPQAVGPYLASMHPTARPASTSRAQP